MRVFVTGPTGALGRYLVPGLVAAGHEVTATTRTPGKVAQLREAGAESVVLDGLDREAVIAAVRAAAPEVVVHQMTALAGLRSLRNPRQDVRRQQRAPDPGHRQPAGGRGAAGIYNVVDDDPAPVAEWLPYLAQVAGAKPPLRLPAWLGRLLAGEFVVAQMTIPGVLEPEGQKELGWVPRYPSWREGFGAWVSG